jgi:hypothetical protein
MKISGFSHSTDLRLLATRQYFKIEVMSDSGIRAA